MVNLFLLRSSLIVLLLISLSGCRWTERAFPFNKKLNPRHLGIIINQSDPLSVKIGEYYQQQRKIPSENLIYIKFKPNRINITPKEFQDLKAQVDAQTPAHIQGYALTWANPYRVDCMSITSAFAFGYDTTYCANGCFPTQESPYFNSSSSRPYEDFQVRPTMAIAATNFTEAKELIDRGVASDNTYPKGTAYLMNTGDKARNVRSQFYPNIILELSQRFPINIIQGDTLENKPDVMFYFTGLKQVQKVESNVFLPGAIADHLTSFGGQLTNSKQMSSLRWLEKGATGSYGTVVEPCNFPQKFPHPGIAMKHYLNGDTLLEAYWKSVAMPGQGIFIGEPLAKPFN
ncbi:conserved hypothetical protein [Gloeothece citriformis PCC 7424]|uniref:TIGR03790 family protein n=1 Tax=Gloeothece citriformis (strain PCC 7424) TaxID=65393 RepID=B7KB68_GLOC7|nr:TIGR03790 family protein [Gloeothece citriformis]ACK71424.1 conserved hypothetical protein [Gloeothece citriformis PCC 7424]